MVVLDAQHGAVGLDRMRRQGAGDGVQRRVEVGARGDLSEGGSEHVSGRLVRHRHDVPLEPELLGRLERPVLRRLQHAVAVLVAQAERAEQLRGEVGAAGQRLDDEVGVLDRDELEQRATDDLDVVAAGHRAGALVRETDRALGVHHQQAEREVVPQQIGGVPVVFGGRSGAAGCARARRGLVAVRRFPAEQGTGRYRRIDQRPGAGVADQVVVAGEHRCVLVQERPGAAEQVALGGVAPEAAELGELVLRLDTLGDHTDVEGAGDADDGRGDAPALRRVEVLDELARQLEAVDGEGGEARQRRVAGAEVVDPDVGADLAQSAEDRLGLLVVDHGRLGDLDDQLAGGEAEAFDQRRHLLCEAPVELADRDVHAHAGVECRCVRRAEFEDLAAEAADQAGLLGEPDEGGGAQPTTCGVVPPSEHFVRAGAVGEVDDGLDVEVDLAVLDRATQVAERLCALGHPVAQRRVEHGIAIAAGTLGGAHRGVGLGDESVRGGAAVGDDDADRGGREVLEAADRERLVEDGAQLLGEHEGAGLTVDRDPDRELVAAHAGDEALRRHVSAEAFGGRHQQCVAGRLPDGVVDELEVVEVDQQHRHERMAAVLQRDGEAVDERLTVGEAGERVGAHHLPVGAHVER